MAFFGNLNNSIAKIPIFDTRSGVEISIEVEMQDYSTVLILLNALDKFQKSISLSSLERPQIEYFIQEYRKIVANGNYKRTESILQKIRSAVKSAIQNLRREPVQKLYFSLNYSLPWTFLSEFYTIDKFDNKCISKTIVNNGKMLNVIDPSVDRLVTSFHGISMKMIYDINLEENKRYSQIFEKITSYLKYLIPILISVVIVYHSISEVYLNPLGSGILYFYIIMLVISLDPRTILINLIKFYIYSNSFISAVNKKLHPLIKRQTMNSPNDNN